MERGSSLAREGEDVAMEDGPMEEFEVDGVPLQPSESI